MQSEIISLFWGARIENGISFKAGNNPSIFILYLNKNQMTKQGWKKKKGMDMPLGIRIAKT